MSRGACPAPCPNKGGLYGDVSFDTSKEILLCGLKGGINYVDTAPWYGQGRSEEVIGKALEGVPRRAYYLATKVVTADQAMVCDDANF